MTPDEKKFPSPNTSKNEKAINFSQEEIRNHLAKYGLPNKFNATLYLPSNGFKAAMDYDLDFFIDFIKEYQGGGEHMDPLKIEFPNDSIYTLPEIKNDLLKYNLPEKVFLSVAQAIRDIQTGKKTQVAEVENVNKNQDSHLSLENKAENQILDESKIIEHLLSDKKFIHIIADTYEGSGIKSIYIGGEEGSFLGSSDRAKNMSLDSEAITHLVFTLGEKISQHIISINDNLLRAIPTLKKFPQGQGYGLVFPIYDPNGRNGAVGYWVIIPDNENETKFFIEKNPATLLKIFNEKFYQSSRWLQKEVNNVKEVSLYQNEFVDTDSQI